MARKKPSIGFVPWQHSLLELIAERLGVTFDGAVACALGLHLYPLACVATFFKHQIEAASGSRLACKDMWAAYQLWHRSRGLRRKVSEDSFAAMALAVCDTKQIAVRVRDNQAVCVDVRLKQAEDRGDKEAA